MAKSWRELGRSWWLPVLLAGVGGVVYLFDPRSAAIYPSCPFRALTGFYCPGCGAGQALYLLLHGEVVGAFVYNPLAVVAAFVGGVLGVAWLVAGEERWQRVLGQRPRLVSMLAALVPVVIVIFWLLRNLPCYPWFPN